MLETTYSGRLRRDYRGMMKQGKDMSLLVDVVEILKRGIPLDEKFQDHPLHGKYEGCRECHIKPDWLLIYQKTETHIILRRTGSHSELL